MSLLDVNGLTVRYGNSCVVDKLSFQVQAGEAVGLVGESGSGKSQTALALLGLLGKSASVEGSVRLAGQELIGAREADLNAVRARRIAMVFQDPAQSLNPYLRVGEQLRRILLAHGLARPDSVDARVVDMLDRVGLPDARRQFRAWPHQLSGGMRQRVMIASALLAEPDVLIADEPTTALDVTVQAQILALLDELRDDTSLLLITHDLGVVAGLCERTLVLERGVLVESGPTVGVFTSPAHEHTRSLLRAATGIAHDDAPVATDSRPVLSAEDVGVSYELTRSQVLHAVSGVDLTVREGETLAIVGESGSGKSSLVRALLGLVPARTGELVFDGSVNDLQLVFQDPVASLNPQMRVASIVAEPLRARADGIAAAEVGNRVAGILEQVGLGREFLRRYPHELSGGQAQRVAIARALVLRPKLLVCDEAVAALDGTVRVQILELLQQIQRETGLSILFITHDLSVVRSISHRVIVMYLGRIVEMADNDALFSDAQHPYTRALLAAVPVPDPRRARLPKTLPGEIPSPLSPPDGCVFNPRCEHARDDCRLETPRPAIVGRSKVACIRASDLAAERASARR
ncbi:MAG: ABC transporter ATP-binding protein [Woeseiaceae bacterium]|nr:ABC transporter ATP-binding protein [Woeseiaceae bacterium]